jgi:Zn-dependent alcohol dehydrogenase
MRIIAAVVRELDYLTIEEIELDAPKAGEICVRIQAAGVCHSDLHTLRGELRATPPLVLGHEGSGLVEEAGAGVTNVKPGDRVLINWLPACEACRACLKGNYTLCESFSRTTLNGFLMDGTSRLKTLDGLQLKHYLGAATMAEYAIVSQEGAIPIPEDVPFEVAAITGCAVATGVGAVIHTARVPAGSSAAVIGCGGVGLSMILGCKLTGCHPIIAVDVMESKLEFARQVGATQTINAGKEQVTTALRKLAGSGPDYVFDSVGSEASIPAALHGVRPGGTAVVAGLHAARTNVPISPARLVLHNKRLLGSFAGSIRPRTDLPQLIELYRAGRLQIDKLITERYSLAELPGAFEDMEAGSLARGVIVFDQ